MLSFIISVIIVVMFSFLFVSFMEAPNKTTTSTECLASMKKLSSSKKLLLTTLVILIAISIIYTLLADTALTDPKFSTIEIEEIYKDNRSIMSDDRYIVKEAGTDNMKKIEAVTILKGNSNLLIKVEYPNMTKLMSFLLGKKSVDYTIVVTDHQNIGNITEVN